MTHDELCPWLDPALANTNNPWCECDLIARVVEREREQAAQRISAADSPPEWVLVIDGDPRPAAAWLMATRMAVAAARGEQE